MGDVGMIAADLSIGAAARTIVLCDDQAVLRGAIQVALSNFPRFQVVGEAVDGVSCQQRVAELRPDVLVMDVSMPGGGSHLVHRLRREHPELQIVMFSGRAENSVQQEMLAAGADRYVVKTGRMAKLLAALEPMSDPWASRSADGVPGSSPLAVDPEPAWSVSAGGPAPALPTQGPRVVLAAIIG